MCTLALNQLRNDLNLVVISYFTLSFILIRIYSPIPSQYILEVRWSVFKLIPL
jgi:hypothetical protein